MQLNLPRVIQILFAIPLLVLTSLNWRFNQIGQNIINLTSSFILIIGLDNILIYYRCFKDKSAIENEATFVIFCLFILGIIFENFNQSFGTDIWFNLLSKYFIIVILILNFSYYLAVLGLLIGYFIRQVYRLMTQTLLSANGNISANQLQNFMQNNKKSFQQHRQRHPTINSSCSICLIQFQTDSQCIILPSCKHCFHSQCINEWLTNKSTCPYCRHNIQLDLSLDRQF